MTTESHTGASPVTNARQWPQQPPEVEAQVEPDDAEEYHVEEQLRGDENGGLTHHPSAPPNELFDIPTTIDPSYIISLIRKLLPLDGTRSDEFHGLAAQQDSFQQPQTDQMEDVVLSTVRSGVLNGSNGNLEAMATEHDDLEESPGSLEIDGEASHGSEYPEKSVIEGTWEESGCVLWDLAANKEHAEFMVENFVLEVLLANLRTSDSVRKTEICLGIIGNLACHEVLMNRITCTNGLLEIVVDQVFSDDAPYLCEVCRLLTSGLQGSQCVVWAKALHSEHILSRVLWICENTLNTTLIERSVLLLLVIMENPEVAAILLPTLMNLGLASLLVNLLAFEMSKLKTERMPERYQALDSILRTIEALSIVDNYSGEICSNKELFQMAMELVKLTEKIELCSSCVTAAVLIANILVDSTDLLLEMSQDFLFLQSVLDLFPFTSDDSGSRNALWSILAGLLLHVQKTEMTPLSFSQYVQTLVSRSDLIEDVLLDNDWDAVANSEAKFNSRTTAIKLLVNILNRWSVVKNDMLVGQNDEDFIEKNYADEKDVQKLLECCLRHST